MTVNRSTDSTSHADRRRRLISDLGDGLVVVRGVAADGHNRNFFYLTGLREPSAVLAMARDGIRIGFGRSHPGPDYQQGHRVDQVLFLPAGDPLLARWGEDSEATVATVTAAQAGVDAVLPLGEMNGILSQALMELDTLHVVRSADPALVGATGPDAGFVEDMRRRFFGVDVRDATPAVHEMRRLKDSDEIDALRRSIRVTHHALERAWAVARPGVMECEVEAEIIARYRAQGGTHAFEPILGSGPNACLLHYERNDRRIEAGELLLIDIGVCLDGYNSDISRTVPVDGTFSPRQREVYEVVLRSLEVATAACKPGVTMGEVHAIGYRAIADAGFGDAFVHGIGHNLGLDTHDVGDRFAPLEPGAVVTIEPGIYLADEALGVRIEDDVLITPDGHDVLSRDIPRTADDIEAAIREAQLG